MRPGAEGQVVVSHHSDGVHDPDEREYATTATFSYSLDLLGLADAGLDASPPDGGELVESGVDAGSDGAPAGQSIADDGGCDCGISKPPLSGSAAGWLMACLAGLVGLRRRSCS